MNTAQEKRLQEFYAAKARSEGPLRTVEEIRRVAKKNYEKKRKQTEVANSVFFPNDKYDVPIRTTSITITNPDTGATYSTGDYVFEGYLGEVLDEELGQDAIRKMAVCLEEMQYHGLSFFTKIKLKIRSKIRTFLMS